jgi:hypothetical protein
MPEINEEQLRQLIEQERQFARDPPPLPPCQLRTIHYTELPVAPPDSQIATEWNFYRRQVGRLLAGGHDGKWVLIKGEHIIGLWNTEEEANRVRIERFLMQPVMMKQILEREPLLRIGYNRLCHS